MIIHLDILHSDHLNKYSTHLTELILNSPFKKFKGEERKEDGREIYEVEEPYKQYYF